MASEASKRRLGFEKHLLHSLDALLYIQLIIIYLHDISTFRFLVGSIIQVILVWKGFEYLPFPVNIKRREVVLILLGYSLYCIAIHAIWGPTQPVGTGSSYLHGGLTIEFIGVKPLDSRLPLILWDLLVLSLQLILFAINYPIADSSPRDGGEGMEFSFSGQMIVRSIPIIQSIFYNWDMPLPTTNNRSSNTANPNEEESNNNTEQRSNSTTPPGSNLV